MSAITDPAKLKVVELRAELSDRGLDTKGNKPVLVKRLREALEAEGEKDLPDTSIADTSTEDLNSSLDSSIKQTSSPNKKQSAKSDEKKSTPPLNSQKVSEPKTPTKVIKDETITIKEIEAVKEEQASTKVTKKVIEEKDMPSAEEEDAPSDVKMDESAEEEQSREEPSIVQDVSDEKMEEDVIPEQTEDVEQTDDVEQPATVQKEEQLEDEQESMIASEDIEMKEEKDDSNQDATDKEPAEPRNRKSRWGSVAEPEPTDSGQDDQQPVEEDVDQPIEAPVSPKSTDESRGEKRRHDSPSPERQVRRRSRSPIKEDEPDFNGNSILLSWLDSDLNLQVNKDGFLSAEPLHNDGFGYMWAGVRATYGFSSGKICYEVKLLENCQWTDVIQKDKNKSSASNADETEKTVPLENTHTFRVGWSLLKTGLQLGEEPYSYAYDSEGFAVSDSQFTEYGKCFASGDVVTAFLDIETDEITMSYSVNGELQPVAFTVSRSDLPENAAFFPHLLTRNIKFEVNFGQNEEPWFAVPEEMEKYTFVKDAEDKVQGLERPEKRQECEVIMMVGLPLSGKTEWVNNYVSENQDKKYTVLGVAHVLDKMKIRGKPRKENFQGNLSILMDKSTRCLYKLVEISGARRRNYILDQTNLFSSAQRRKMRPFDGFRRRAVVIVLADDEQSSREKSSQQADGKDVPDSTVLEMKANMYLPSVCEWLDEVTFINLDEAKAKEMVQKYNKMGREAGYATKQHSNNQKSKSGGSTGSQQDRRGQWNRNNSKGDKKRDNRDNRNNRWSGSSGGGGGGAGGGGGSGGHGHNRPNNWGGNRGSGNWGRHDNRNHHGGGGGGGGYRNNPNNRMLGGPGGGGGGYNRNQRGGSSYNRDRNAPPHRNQMQKQGGNWGGQGGGNWGNQGNWSGQGGWAQGQGGGSGSGWSEGNWGQYGNQGSNSNSQWRGGNYSSQGQYQQQSYPQGYQPGQYGGQPYTNWNYYGQYAQGWCTPQGNVKKTQSGFKNHGENNNSQSDTNNSQYNQYSQQQQAVWAQYAQSGFGGYDQSQGNSNNSGAIAGSTATQPASK